MIVYGSTYTLYLGLVEQQSSNLFCNISHNFFLSHLKQYSVVLLVLNILPQFLQVTCFSEDSLSIISSEQEHFQPILPFNSCSKILSSWVSFTKVITPFYITLVDFWGLGTFTINIRRSSSPLLYQVWGILAGLSMRESFWTVSFSFPISITPSPSRT